MELLRKLLAIRQVKIALGCLAGVGIAGGVIAWKMGMDLASLKEMWTVTEVYLKQNPWALFLALVILPGLPIPTSVLMLTAGVVWREQPLMACSLCLVALALNFSWTYWLAAGPARRLVEKILAAISIQVPDLPRADHLKLILVLRLTPGIPLFFQNYLLGVLRAPFHLYLPVSMLCTGIIATGVVLSGAGLADGKLKWAITGVSLIVLGGVFTHLIRGWLAKRKLNGLKTETLKG
ncbi:MAG: VTT domain-containing protein [Verrucomicrobiota bacterium]